MTPAEARDYPRVFTRAQSELRPAGFVTEEARKPAAHPQSQTEHHGSAQAHGNGFAQGRIQVIQLVLQKVMEHVIEKPEEDPCTGDHNQFATPVIADAGEALFIMLENKICSSLPFRHLRPPKAKRGIEGKIAP